MFKVMTLTNFYCQNAFNQQKMENIKRPTIIHRFRHICNILSSELLSKIPLLILIQFQALQQNSKGTQNFPQNKMAANNEGKQKIFETCLSKQDPFFMTYIGIKNFKEQEKNSAWTKQENAKYAMFIELNFEKMDGKDHRSLWKLYGFMARHIKTRNYRQCKLHHQKLLNEHKKIQNIVQFLIRSDSELFVIYNQQKSKIRNYETSLSPIKMSTQDTVQTDVYYRIGSYTQLNGQICQLTQKNKEESLKSCGEFLAEWTNRFRNFNCFALSA